MTIHKCVAFVTTSHLQRGKAGSVVIDRLSVSRLIHSLGRPSGVGCVHAGKVAASPEFEGGDQYPLDRFDFHLP